MEANEFTAMTPTPFNNHPLREPCHREPDQMRALTTRPVACRLQNQKHHASQPAHRPVALPPFVVAGGIRMGIARNTAQFGSKGFVS